MAQTPLVPSEERASSLEVQDYMVSKFGQTVAKPISRWLKYGRGPFHLAEAPTLAAGHPQALSPNPKPLALIANGTENSIVGAYRAHQTVRLHLHPPSMVEIPSLGGNKSRLLDPDQEISGSMAHILSLGNKREE